MISRRQLRVKAFHIMYAYFNSEEKELKKVEKELEFSIKKLYDLYYYLFMLIIDIRLYADNQIELKRNKRIPTNEDLNPNTRFIDNKFIAQISDNIMFKRFFIENKLSWVQHPELIKKLYNLTIESDFYKEYMLNKECSYKDDKWLVSKIFNNLILPLEDLDEILEDQSIYWNDDLEFVISMIIKTIKKFEENDPEDKALLPLYKNEDDRDFVIKLFRKGVANFSKNKELIDEHTKNWEVDRIAFLDILLLDLAITEITEFPSIPVKVTFNEYIEISKFYSTQKSSVFINGVLDKILKVLKDNKQVVKKGRGLFED